MSLIKNLVKEPEKKESKSDPNDSDEDIKQRPIIKSALDLQRLKLSKLMKNPEKPVVIPEHRREKDYMQSVPSFVRNVMGSSAGAGSGEFHVYRHLRRKEYARQKMIQHKSVQEQLDDDYQNKLEENRRIAEEKTAKKRAKRLKKKQKAKKPRQQKPLDESSKVDEDAESSSDSNEDAAIKDGDDDTPLLTATQQTDVSEHDLNCSPELNENDAPVIVDNMPTDNNDSKPEEATSEQTKQVSDSEEKKAKNENELNQP